MTYTKNRLTGQIRPTLYHSCKPRANSLNAPDRSTVGNGTTA